MEVITQTGTQFIALFIQNIEHCSLIMLPSKTISVYMQDDATHPINCTGPITITIRLMGTKNIYLALERCCSHRLQVTNRYKHHKTYTEVS